MKDKITNMLILSLILNKYKLMGIIIGNAMNRDLLISVAIKICRKINGNMYTDFLKKNYQQI